MENKGKEGQGKGVRRVAEKRGWGLPRNTAAGLAYVLGLLSGAVILAVERNDEYVRYHAFQSIGLSVVWLGGWIVLTIIPVLGWILLPFWGLLMFVFWLVAMVKAWQGQWFRLPIIGEYVARYGKKS
ncbi:MAG: DUF4870 domain-containing protein [Candidatus Chisholmbacteria bacterium]|nr:DUF4870 domain-containing protein [Candidatus Chisholmbacteria bacterium]